MNDTTPAPLSAARPASEPQHFSLEPRTCCAGPRIVFFDAILL